MRFRPGGAGSEDVLCICMVLVAHRWFEVLHAVLLESHK
jgi:hypothetical protein